MDAPGGDNGYAFVLDQFLNNPALEFDGWKKSDVNDWIGLVEAMFAEQEIPDEAKVELAERGLRDPARDALAGRAYPLNINGWNAMKADLHTFFNPFMCDWRHHLRSFYWAKYQGETDLQYIQRVYETFVPVVGNEPGSNRHWSRMFVRALPTKYSRFILLPEAPNLQVVIEEARQIILQVLHQEEAQQIMQDHLAMQAEFNLDIDLDAMEQPQPQAAEPESDGEEVVQADTPSDHGE